MSTYKFRWIKKLKYDGPGFEFMLDDDWLDFQNLIIEFKPWWQNGKWLKVGKEHIYIGKPLNAPKTGASGNYSWDSTTFKGWTITHILEAVANGELLPILESEREIK